MNKNWLIFGCAMVAALGSRVAPVQADIKYTQEMRMGDASKDQPPMSKTTTYVKQGFERAESTTQFGPVSMEEVTLTLCEKKQRVRMNPKLKIYTIASTDEKASAAKTTEKPDAAPAQQEEGGTGKMEITYGVQDLGEEKVAGFQTHHYMIEMQMKSSGCAGNSDTKTKMEIWVTDIQDAHGCHDVSVNPAQAMVPPHANGGCKIDFVMKGDSDKISNIYRGLVMRMKMYNDDKVMMVQEITMLSQAKLEDDPFTIPADYQQVTEEEFQQKQSQAMMKAVMEKSKAGGNDNNDNNNDGNNAEADKDKKDETPAEEQPQEEKKPKVKKPRFKLPF